MIFHLRFIVWVCYNQMVDLLGGATLENNKPLQMYYSALIMLYVICILFFINVIAGANIIFGTWIHWPLYFLMLLMPSISFVMLIIKKTIKVLMLCIISIIPFVTFTIWFLEMLRRLGEVLQHF